MQGGCFAVLCRDEGMFVGLERWMLMWGVWREPHGAGGMRLGRNREWEKWDAQVMGGCSQGWRDAHEAGWVLMGMEGC